MADTIDRRTARTQKALKGAMLELLNKKDITKITVSELTKMTDIGRGTFYLHFSDPYDLLDKLENEVLEQITALSGSIMEKHDYDDILIHLEIIWRYMYENMDTFKVLTNRRNGTHFIEKFKRHFEKITLSAMKKDGNCEYEDVYSVVYFISGSLGIFERWMEEGAPIPPDRLAQIVRGLIMGAH